MKNLKFCMQSLMCDKGKKNGHKTTFASFNCWTTFKGLRTVVLKHEDNNWEGFWVKVLYAWPYTVWRLESGVTSSQE